MRVSILVTPEPNPRLQRLEVRSVPELSPALLGLAAEVVALAGLAAPSWPQARPLAPALDRAVVERELWAAGARFGTLALGRPLSGDGRTEATFELASERGRAVLWLGLDATGLVTVAAVVPAVAKMPSEAW